MSNQRDEPYLLARLVVYRDPDVSISRVKLLFLEVEPNHWMRESSL